VGHVKFNIIKFNITSNSTSSNSTSRQIQHHQIHSKIKNGQEEKDNQEIGKEVEAEEEYYHFLVESIGRQTVSFV